MRKTMRSLQKNLRKSWILELAENLLAAVPMSREEVNRKYCFEFEEGSYRCMVVRLLQEGEEHLQPVSEILEECCCDYEWILQGREAFFLMNYRDSMRMTLWKRLKALAGPQLQIAVSRENSGIDDCAAAMREAKRTINMRWWKRDAFFLTAEEFEGLLTEEAPVLNHERTEQLLRQIEMLDPDKIGRAHV